MKFFFCPGSRLEIIFFGSPSRRPGGVYILAEIFEKFANYCVIETLFYIIIIIEGKSV